MKIKVIGIEQQDYKLDNGYQFKGKKVHFKDMETQKTGLTGNLTGTLKIPDDSPLAVIPIEIDHEYTCFFNQKGALDYLATISADPQKR